jgi:hypothetical protein
VCSLNNGTSIKNMFLLMMTLLLMTMMMMMILLSVNLVKNIEGNKEVMCVWLKIFRNLY